jgi:hypothetical protein
MVDLDHGVLPELLVMISVSLEWAGILRQAQDEEQLKALTLSLSKG